MGFSVFVDIMKENLNYCLLNNCKNSFYSTLMNTLNTLIISIQIHKS